MENPPKFIAYMDAAVIKNFNTLPPISQDEFVHENVGRFVGTQIDAMVYNMFNWNDVVPMYPTEVPEARRIYLDSFKSAGEWREKVNLQWMIANDPWQAVVQTAHDAGIQFWAGMRFNDIHNRRWESEFRVNHPDYVLGYHAACPGYRQANPAPSRGGFTDYVLGYAPKAPNAAPFCTAFNYGLPQVRAHRLRMVEEVCSRYDVDGFEWDFTRHPGAHFTDMDEGRTILNDYMREVRRLLNRLGQTRGRPIGFGVRTWQTLEVSYDLALDIRTWVRDGLVDYVSPSPGGGSVTDPFFGPFLELAKDADCRIYGCTSEHLDHRWHYPAPHWGATPSSVLRAGALNAWQQGVDGIYLYNLNSLVNHPPQEGNPLDVLSQMGSPAGLEFEDKVYAVTFHEPDIHGRDELPPIEFEVEPHGPGKTIRFTVGDDLSKAARLGILDELTLELIVGEPGGDVVEFILNGKPLPRNPRLAHTPAVTLKNRPVEKNMKLVYDLRSGEYIRQGENSLTVIVREREPSLLNKFTVYDLTLAIRYRTLPMRARY